RRARRLGEGGPRRLGARGWLGAAAIAGALAGAASGCDRLDAPSEAVEPLPDDGSPEGEGAGGAGGSASKDAEASPAPTTNAAVDATGAAPPRPAAPVDE